MIIFGFQIGNCKKCRSVKLVKYETYCVWLLFWFLAKWRCIYIQIPNCRSMWNFFTQFLLHVLPLSCELDLELINWSTNNVKWGSRSIDLFNLDALAYLKWRGATWDFTFMLWIIANEWIILSVPEYLINELIYGVLHQLPAISNPNSKHSL